MDGAWFGVSEVAIATGKRDERGSSADDGRAGSRGVYVTRYTNNQGPHFYLLELEHCVCTIRPRTDVAHSEGCSRNY